MDIPPDDWNRCVEELFNAASELPEAERNAFLERQCNGDPRLRREVEALLAAERAAGRFFSDPTLDAGAAAPGAAAPAGSAAAQSRAQGVGTEIGHYKLIGQLGRGTFGTVFLAEQFAPVRREVALKRLNPGMNSDHVLARFEAERQTLAVMEHPNIAKVFDAGQTAGGYPYFVMELVRDGVPITRYCDQHLLDVRQRLALFVLVCQAVHHAHQKGVIHRDLKPANILVAECDGVAVPKIIDFGIAKALDRPFLDASLTGIGAVLGTLEYMSPEQAGGNVLDVDTRSDIYSLGAILYELLAGTTPLKEKLSQSPELGLRLKVVQETDPPTPSTRLVRAPDTLMAIAQCRGTEPQRLERLLQGDLDCIVMTALAKDRGERYQTAIDLAKGLVSFLAGEIVAARPPTLGYRAGKFVRRHRGPVLAASLLFLALTGGTVGTTTGLVRERAALKAESLRRHEAETERDQKEQARREAHASELKALSAAKAEQLARSAEASRRRQAESVAKLMEDAFRPLDPAYSGQSGIELKDRLIEFMDVAAARLASDYPDDPEIRARLRSVIGIVQVGLSEPTKGAALFRSALEDQRRAGIAPDDPSAVDNRVELAICLRMEGHLPEAIQLLQSERATLTKRLGADAPESLLAGNLLADTFLTAGRVKEAISLYEETWDRQKMWAWLPTPGHQFAINCLALAYQAAGHPADAVAFGERGSAMSKLLWGPDALPTLTARNNLGMALSSAGRNSEAMTLFEGLRSDAVRALGPEHRLTLTVASNLGEVYQRVGRIAEAVDLLNTTLQGQERRIGPMDQATLRTANDLGMAQMSAGRIDSARKLFRRAAEGLVKTAGADHPMTLTAQCNYAFTLIAARQPGQALDMLNQVYQTRVKVLGEDHPDTLAARVNQAGALGKLGRSAEAVTILEQVRGPLAVRLGPDHPDVLSSLALLGSTYTTAGRAPEAVALLQDVHDRQARVLGEDHPQTLLTQNELALALWSAGRGADSLKLYKAIAQREEKLFGPDDPVTLQTVHDMAIVDEFGVHQLADAIALFQRVLERRKSVFGPDHWDTLDTQRRLAFALWEADRAAEAVPLYEDVVKRMSATLGPDHRDTLTALDELGYAYDRAGRAEDAVRTLTQAHEGRSKVLGPADRKTLKTLRGLVGALRKAGRITDAIDAGQRCVDLSAKTFGPDHQETQLDVEMLAGNCEAAGQYARGAELWDRLRKSYERTEGADHEDTLFADACLASNLAMQGRHNEAIEAFQRLLPRQHDPQQRADLQARMSLCMLEAGRFADAEPLLRQCLEYRQANAPEHWTTYNTRAMLGGSLLGQKRYADAEPLLLEGYAGMNRQVDKIPGGAMPRFFESIERLVRLYEQTDRKDQADTWRARLAQARAATRPAP